MNTFTFPNPIHHDDNNNDLKKSDSDATMKNYEFWAERIREGQYNKFSRPGAVKFGAWKRRSPGDDDDDDDAGTPWPELGKKAVSSPERSRNYLYDTDNLRAQNIERYRQEMLDLTRRMPETAYELSLRDLVESPTVTTPLKEEDDDETKNIGKKMEKQGARGTSRSESMDKGGFVLKMFIPRIPTVLRRKKSMVGSKSESTGAKVSPKPVLRDREWWNEEFGAMSGGGGSPSSSSGKGSRKLLGCYPPFFWH